MRWTLLLGLMVFLVSASDHSQCIDLEVSVNSTTVQSQPACLDVTLNADCEMHLHFTLDDIPLLSGSLDVEISRTLCTSYGACDICVDVTDFYLHAPANTSEELLDADVCLSVSTRHCLVDSLEASQDFGCFTIPQTAASACVHCPRECGGVDQGTCDHGRCICKDNWQPPLCVTNGTVPDDRDPFAPPTNTSQCWRPLPPLPLMLCADTHEYDCNAMVDLSINGDTVVHFEIDLPRSEDLLEAQCQQLFQVDDGACEVCVVTTNLTRRVSHGNDVFEYCQQLVASSACNQFLLASQEPLEPLDLGCYQVLASSCHRNCSAVCEEHGTCVEGICQCEEGWTGRNCDERQCLPDPECGDNGACVQGQCVCDPGYFGDACAEQCELDEGGRLLDNQKFYGQETTVPVGEENPWRGFLDVPVLYGAMEIDLACPQNITEVNQDLSLLVLVRFNCPPTLDSYDTQFRADLVQGGVVLHQQQTFSLGRYCEQVHHHEFPNEKGTWYFAIYSQGDTPSASFGVRIWMSELHGFELGSKYLGELVYPHVDYFNFTLPSYGEWTARLKVKANEYVADALEADESILEMHLQQDHCPLFPDPRSLTEGELYLSQGEVLENSLYDYQYVIEQSVFSNGSQWFLYVQPLVDCPEDRVCHALSYSLEIFQRFICYPPCAHNASCSTYFPNTCECDEVGYTGDRCTEPFCDRRCGPHGQCVAPNVCKCEEGWEGEMCIDIAHQVESVPLRLLSDWNFTYYVVFGLIVFTFLFVVFLVVVKLRRDQHLARDLKELGTYLAHCCRQPEPAPPLWEELNDWDDGSK